jgi:hypothetical protein
MRSAWHWLTTTPYARQLETENSELRNALMKARLEIESVATFCPACGARKAPPPQQGKGGVMNWYDWGILALCWSLPVAAIAMRVYRDAMWRRKFGERKPR